MRLIRAVSGVAKAVGLGVTFTLAGLGGALLHAGLPPARRLVLAQVNRLIEGTFEGEIVVRRIGALGLAGFEGVDAEVLDPEGHRALLIQDASARLGAVTALRSLVGGGRLVLRVPELGIGSVEVVIAEDEAGTLSIQKAFEPRGPAPPRREGASRGVEIAVPDIRVRHVWVHGRTASVPLVDADLEGLLASFGSTPDATEIGVEHVRVRGRGLPGLNPEGVVAGRASLPSEPEGDARVSAQFEGRVGEIPVVANGVLDGRDVDVAADVPEASPGAIEAIAPGIALGAPVSGHAEVHGRLPVLFPEVRARIGPSEIAAEGAVTLPEEGRPEILAAVKARVSDLDVSLLQRGSPGSNLTAAVDASAVSLPGGAWIGALQLRNEAGEWAGQGVPAAIARGDFTERSVRGAAWIAERGAPTSVLFSLQPKGGSGAPALVDVAAETRIDDIRDVERLGPLGRGSAHLVALGSVDLEARRGSGSVTGEVAGLRVQGVELARGILTGTAEGPLDSPGIQVQISGAGLRAGGYSFERVRASANGPPEALDVSVRLIGERGSPHLAASGRVARGEDIQVLGARVRVEREDAAAWAKVDRIRIVGDTVRVQGATIEGLGEPVKAAARIAPGAVGVEARSEGVNLALLAALLGRERETQGRLSLDVDVAARGRAVRGRVDANVDDLSVRRVGGGSVRVSAAVDGDRVRGEVVAALGEAGRLVLSAPDIRLGGPAMEPSAWEKAAGTVEVDGALALDRLVAALPEDVRPVERAAGDVTIRGSVSRSSAAASPSVRLEVATEGLVLVAKPERIQNVGGSVTVGPAPWRTEGLDGSLAVQIDEETGHTEVSARLHDERGPFVIAGASAELPIDRMIQGLSSPGTGELRRLLGRSEIAAEVAVPRRSFDAMPAALGVLPVKGEVEIEGALTGTLEAPSVTLTAKATRLLPRAEAPCARGMDVATKVTYDGERAEVSLAATRDDAEIAGISAIVKVSAAKALAGGALGWEAAGSAALEGFPLEAAGAFLDQPISGSVSGKIALEGLHRDAALTADLDLRDLVFHRSAIPRGEVRVGVKDERLTASVRLDQADGHLATTVKGAVAWGAEVAPELDLGKALEVAVSAESFRANAAAPFVRGTLEDLDGRIDADVRLRVERGGAEGHMDGAVTLREGVLLVPQLGERFHSIQGRVIMHPWGTLRFERFSAEASTGKLTASGEAVLDGLALRSASGKIEIAEGASIPVSVEGVPIGRAYGQITAKAKMSEGGERLDVAVDVPRLHVSLPPSTGHTVQPLEPDETIRIGHHVDGGFALLPLEPPEEPVFAPEGPAKPSGPAIVTTIRLGPDVALSRDTTMHVEIDGQVKIAAGGETRIDGQIRLTRGRLELQGKMFVIDHGTVSFVGADPSNPMIVASAHWDAPDQTRVFMEFSGRASSGRLELRSEPALTQPEILSLILFGSRDGGFGVEPPRAQRVSTGARAVGLAGGVVTQAVNKAISGITTADITTRVDTSDAANPRPELAVQLSKDVSARLSYNLGVPAPGQNPDRTELTVEWRFVRSWSLVAGIGDQGSSSVDVVWRLRY